MKNKKIYYLTINDKIKPVLCITTAGPKDLAGFMLEPKQ